MPIRSVRANPGRSWIKDRRGNIAILTALILPALIGGFGLGSEVAYWFFDVRAMQNAADSAAVAAATNGSSSYATEVRAVTALYGFQNSVHNVTVTASNAAACPSGGNACYRVTVTSLVPQFLSQIVGYKGATVLGGVRYTQLTATATATIQANGDACVLVLDGSDAKATTITGGTTTLQNCDLWVDSNNSDALSMSGGAINASAIGVVGNYQTSGGTLNPKPNTGGPVISDPYAGLYAANNVASLKSQPCTYTNKNVSSSATLTPGVYCGGLNISGGTVTFQPGVYVIEGGKLSFSGGASSGSGVTFVLTTNGNQYATAQLTGGSTNFAAPTSGSWAGMLFYQDPTEATKVGTSQFTGGANTLTGTLYFPTQAVDYTGGATNSACTEIVAYTLDLTGGSTIGSSCAGTGVQAIPVPGRGQLVT